MATDSFNGAATGQNWTVKPSDQTHAGLYMIIGG